MILPESVDNVLKNPVVRFIAAVGLLLLTANVLAGVFFNLVDLAGSNVIFDRVWRIRYLDLAATLITAGIWFALATTRRFEQPWWILVALAFLVWMFLITPLATYLPEEVFNLVGIVAFALRGFALLLALPTLDRAIPKTAISNITTPGLATPGVGAYTPNVGPAPAVPTMDGHVDHLVDPMSQPQPGAAPQAPAPTQAAAQAAGWYPDPRGQATWRWWDGSTWTENVS